MRFLLSIDTDGAVFADTDGWSFATSTWARDAEVARILRHCADLLELNYAVAPITITDKNSNVCGMAQYSPQD